MPAFRFGLFLFSLVFLSAPSFAAETSASLPIVKLRAGEHPSFDRIVFDAPRGTDYKIDRDGPRVTLSLSVPARLALRKIYLTRAKDLAVVSGADGLSPLTVRFFVADGATVKDFRNDLSIVLDVSGPAAKLPEAEKTAPQPKPQPQTESEKEPPKEKPTESSVAPTPAPAPVAPVQESLAPPPEPKRLPPALDPQTAKELLAIAEEKETHPVLSFDARVSMGLAVFLRGGYVTILFDRKLTQTPFAADAPQRVKTESFDLPYTSALRFAVPESVDVRATREGTIWKIFLVPAGVGPGLSTEFVAQPDFALGARLLIPTAEPPEPIFFTDKVVGDALLALPLRETTAFTALRRLADFQIIPAAQGLVLKPKHERLVARIVPDGVEITAEGGLKLSPRRDTGATSGKEDVRRLFDLERWQGWKSGGFTETRQKLMQTIVGVPEEQRVLARMDLVRFYFAHGRGKEAAALLDIISKSLPEIESKSDFIALRGAARLLAGNVDQGMKDLESPALADQLETTLWQAIGAAFSQDWGAAADRFRLSFSILESYPEPFRSRFIVLAAEAALAAGKDKDAAEWLSFLDKKGEVEAAYKPALLYLRGALEGKAGHVAAAERFWREAAQSRDRLYKTRAELALVDMGVATKSLSAKQAIDRLEGLRFAWRGDSLEFDILRRLGGFYIDAKKFRDGLLVFAQALRLYPTSPLAPRLKAEMQKLFLDLFLTPLGEDLAPLQALELYADFKNLIPEGEKGNAVRRQLAERLVAIDLLDQAGNLLEDVIRNAPSPEERAQTATRLAAVRLLDRQAEKALRTLEQSQTDALAGSANLGDERSLLRARALSDMGRREEAIAALPASDSEQSKLLRADIAMRAKRWDEAALALLSLVGTPPADNEKLPENKAEWVSNIALALALQGDEDGLRRLADAYGHAMDKTSRAGLFRLLTRPDKSAPMKDLAAASARLSEVDMFKGFLDGYRKEP